MNVVKQHHNAFHALTLLVGWREGYPACKNVTLAVPKGVLCRTQPKPEWSVHSRCMQYTTVTRVCTLSFIGSSNPKWKKALGETQTLCAGCSKAETKIFALLQTPFPGVQDGQNLRFGDGHYLHLKTQFGEDRCMHFWVVVVTDPQRNKHTHTQTGPITIHCTAKRSVQYS